MESRKPPEPEPGHQPPGVADQSAAYQIVESFVAGQLPADEFERTLSENRSLPALLGEDLYLDLLSSNFGDPREAETIRSGLAELLRLLSHSVRADAPRSKFNQSERSDHDN